MRKGNKIRDTAFPSSSYTMSKARFQQPMVESASEPPFKCPRRPPLPPWTGAIPCTPAWQAGSAEEVAAQGMVLSKWLSGVVPSFIACLLVSSEAWALHVSQIPCGIIPADPWWRLAWGSPFIRFPLILPFLPVSYQHPLCFPTLHLRICFGENPN